jgi:signal transduction histidine kinase
LRYRNLCLLLLVFQSVLVTGQRNSYINFSVAEGLPSSEVYYAIQDRNGFIWFATDNGVVKFDGAEFEIINTNSGLSDPVVFGIHEDPYGRIWFRTFTGKLSYYQDGQVHKYQHNESILKDMGKSIISDFYYDSLDNIWLAAAAQIFRFDKDGQLQKQKTSLNSVELFPLTPNKDILAFSGPTQRVHWALINNHRIPIHHSDTTQAVGFLCNITWQGKKYFSINRDLFEYTSSSATKVYTTSKPIISLSIDLENQLWIGELNGGVTRANDDTFTGLGRISELNENSVSKVLQDNEKGYWITTLEKGVFYFPNFSIHSYSNTSSAKLSSASATADKVITTDYSGQTIAYDKASLSVAWIKYLNHPIITSHTDQKGNIWVSTNEETMLFNPEGEIIKDRLPPNMIDLAESGGFVYGVNTFGIFMFDLNGNIVQKKLQDVQYRSVYADDLGMYLGGKNGLFQFNHNVDLIRELNPFTDIKVTNITPLTDSLLLISTIGNGFFVLHQFNDTLKNYNTESGFFANNIYCVLKTDSTLWLGTENGIAITNLNSLAVGNPNYKFITQYSGLLGNKVNFLLALPERVMAFSDEGYSLLPFNQINYINMSPVPYIKELRINNSKVDFRNNLKLASNNNNIQIKLGFLSFNNQHILTRYRLSADAAWIRSEDWTFAFSSMSPGIYRFESEYSIDNLNWNTVPIEFIFTIQPPWWSSWYFRITTGMFLLAGGLVLYRRRVNRYKEKAQYLGVINDQQKKLLDAEIEATERERTRIAKDLHDGISIDLVAIKLMLNKVSKKLDSSEANEIENQLQKTLADIKSIIYGLTPPGLELFGLSAGLQNYITIINKTSAVKINLTFIGDEIRDQSSGSIIFRIIQELIANSLKHSNCDSIQIQMARSDERIIINYTDDGIGFDPEQVRVGLGLSNIQSRVESLKGNIQLASGPTGTRYEIEIPVARK